jgi:hypothetical protein
MREALFGSNVVRMNTPQQLAVREQVDATAHRPIVKIATRTSRSNQHEPKAAPTPRRTRPWTFLRQMLDSICQAGQPAATPQAPLVWPNGAVTWTPHAVDSMRQTTATDRDPD